MYDISVPVQSNPEQIRNSVYTEVQFSLVSMSTHARDLV